VRGYLKRLYETHGEKMRYLIVGAFNTTFGYALFLMMLVTVRSALNSLAALELTIPGIISSNYFLIAQWTAWILSVPVGTYTMKHHAFRSPGRLGPQIGRAYLVYAPQVALNSAVLWIAVQLLNMPPEIGQLIATGVAVAFGYLGHKYFTFRVEPHGD